MKQRGIGKLVQTECMRCGKKLMTIPSDRQIYADLGSICKDCITAEEAHKLNMESLENVRIRICKTNAIK